MTNREKTKGQLINELVELRQRIAELEASETEPKRAEKALRQSENKYRTLLENLPQKIFHKDKDSVYVSCNGNYARDLKIKPEDINGKTDYEFFPEGLAEKYRADDKRIVASGKTEDIEEMYIQDGQERWVHTVKTPVKDERGNITGVLGIFWDITERVLAEEALRQSEEQFRNFLDNLGDIAYEADSSGNITYANKMSEIITGVPLRDIIGKPFLPMFTKESQQIAIDVYQRTLNGESPEYELVLSNGKICHFKNEPLRDNNGDIIGLFGIARDVTERVRLQESILKAHDELERRVDERTVKLAKANEQLKQEITQRKRTEEALRESEEKYRTILESIEDGYYETDIRGSFTFLNNSMCKISGYSRDELMGMNYKN